MNATRFARTATLICIGGALLHLGVGAAQFVDPVEPAQPGLPFTVTAVLSHLMVLAGVVALAASQATGAGWLPRIGLPIAGLGWVLIAAAELTVWVNFPLATALFAVADPAIGIGMVLTGVAVIRSGHLHGWRRFAPLACGLYPFAVELPAFGIFGIPNTPAITGIGLVWLALGVALWTTTNAGAKRTAVSGAASTRAAR